MLQVFFTYLNLSLYINMVPLLQWQTAIKRCIKSASWVCSVYFVVCSPHIKRPRRRVVFSRALVLALCQHTLILSVHCFKEGLQLTKKKKKRRIYHWDSLWWMSVIFIFFSAFTSDLMWAATFKALKVGDRYCKRLSKAINWIPCGFWGELYDIKSWGKLKDKSKFNKKKKLPNKELLR